MDIKNWFGNFFKKSHSEVALPYVTGNTFREWGTSSISSPYKQNGTVRRSIDIMSFNLAQLPLLVYKNSKKLPTDLLDPNNIQIGSLLQRPNEYMSGFKFKLIHWSYFLLYDKVFWLLGKNPFGIVKNIYVLNPSYVATKYKDNEVDHYIYNNTKVLPEDMICFSGFNPSDLQGLGGSSILETIKIELETETSAATYGKKVFENGTRLSGVIEIDKDAATNDAEMKKVLVQWNLAHQGEKNSHKVGILSPGMHYIERGMSMRDVEYVEGRKEIKERIIEVYGIPKSVYGLVDKIDRATADTQMRQFWQVTLKPLAIMMQEDMNSSLMRDNYAGTTVKYDFTVVEELKKDLNETADAARKYFELGYTRNEINDRFKLDMDDEETGDIRYVPTSLIEVDEALEMEPIEENKRLDELLEKYIEETTVEKEVKAKDSFRTRFLKDQRNQEKAFHSKIKRFIFEYRKEVISVVNASKAVIDETSILNALNKLKNEQDTKLAKMTEPLYLEATKVSEQAALDLLNISAVAEGDAALANTYANRIKGMNATITSKLREEVQASVIAGDSVAQLSGKLKDVYNFSTSRSKIIARTESANIMSEASFKTYKKHGIKYKEWLSAGDSKVRATHKNNASQGAIPIDQEFDSGEFFPSSVNCRCSISPAFKES